MIHHLYSICVCHLHVCVSLEWPCIRARTRNRERMSVCHWIEHPSTCVPGICTRICHLNGLSSVSVPTCHLTQATGSVWPQEQLLGCLAGHGIPRIVHQEPFYSVVSDASRRVLHVGGCELRVATSAVQELPPWAPSGTLAEVSEPGPAAGTGARRLSYAPR
jgi:hypothetical protein